jgi:hypothetical protein
MKIAVTYRPRSTPPLEAAPMMMDGLEQWLKAYEDKFEFVYFFGGGGGFGVGDFEDSAEVQKMMAEHPFTLFSDVEVKVVLDGATAIANLKAAMAARG